MTDITEEQWEVLRLRRSQQDLQLILTALAVDGSVTIAGNSEPPPPEEDAPEDAPEPVVTTAQAEAELTALAADLDAQAAEQAKEAEEKAAKEADEGLVQVRGKGRMNHTQSTILLIEVGIIALLLALGYLPRRP